jgi:hypothetical protein
VNEMWGFKTCRCFDDAEENHGLSQKAVIWKGLRFAF